MGGEAFARLRHGATRRSGAADPGTLLGRLMGARLGFLGMSMDRPVDPREADCRWVGNAHN
jgi:hypothetical protein